jgi:DNA-binding GntR family transcriptional regulator
VNANTPTSLTLTVAARLRAEVKTSELPAGARLRQTELARRFGVSTTPVREALRVLSNEGLVRHDDRRGAVVFPPTLQDLRENYEIRLAPEPPATALAAPRMSPRDLDAIASISSQLGDVVAQHDEANGRTSRYEELDRAFHARIFGAAERPQLAAMIRSLRDAASAYAHLHAGTGPAQELMQTLQVQHEQLGAALRRHDADAAQRIASEHVRTTGKRHGF